MDNHSKKIEIALVGNPNCGKTSLFNLLTGLNQKVGNFPGVTVDKKTGTATISDELDAHVIDLPGTYSIYPRREDEWVAYNVLMQIDTKLHPKLVVLVVDASNLKRNLLFCSQLIDLGYNIVVALTMVDVAAKKGIKIDVNELSRALGVPVMPINARTNKGIPQLKKTIAAAIDKKSPRPSPFIDVTAISPAIAEAGHLLPATIPAYAVLHKLVHTDVAVKDKELREKIKETKVRTGFNETKAQAEEVLLRYQKINTIIHKTVVMPDPLRKKIISEKLDNILLHRFWGYIVLFAVIFILFQCVFWLAAFPMDAIDEGFASLTSNISSMLPNVWWADLIVNGILAGIGGIVVFVPQIMILFGIISILEDTGYMARISFLMDKLMRKVGLNGKSVMPMISGFACAIPAVMSARNIENRKERLLTILITPLMSCSARLPVYIILIALVIPDTVVAGFISLQGLVMMGMYLLGFVVALIVSWLLNKWIKIEAKSFFILELPAYKSPRWTNVVMTMYEKAKIFLVEAGKIIMIISIVIWFLSSFGPSARMQNVEQEYAQVLNAAGNDQKDVEKEYSAAKLENSYAGILGKAIEPAISPLGFDWKIGIAIITSFAAREVFVGTMATIYSVDASDETTLKQKMANAERADGSKVYTLATGLSLMIFYVFAMQCMSTLAIVKRETKTWKWPIFQLVYMTGLAYLFSFLAFQLFK